MNATVKDGAIVTSPFVGIENGSQVNINRSKYISAEIVQQVIDAAKCG